MPSLVLKGLLIALPVLLFAVLALAVYAFARQQATMVRYMRVPTSRGWSGGQVARELLTMQELYHVRIEMGDHWMVNYFDPRNHVIYLSPEVYSNASVAAVTIASHEVGHAIQSIRESGLFQFRIVMVPFINILIGLAVPLGLLVGAAGFLKAAGLLLAVLVLAQTLVFLVVVIPVEAEANRLAEGLLVKGRFITEDERESVRNMLKASLLAYFTAPALTLLRLLRRVLPV